MATAAEAHELPLRFVVAGNIRSLMGRNRVSQTQLALVVGCSQPTLSKRLDGHTPAFDLDELERIAFHFDVTIEDLCRSSCFGTSVLLTGLAPYIGDDDPFEPDPDVPTKRCLTLVGG